VVLAERWIRYGAAAFVAGACVRFTSPDASPLPAFLAAAYGAMLPRLAEAGAAGERDRERWATNLPSDLVVVGAGLSPFAFWLLRGLARYPAGSWEHLIAQAAFQLATVTSAVALASWVSLRWPTPLHWHHHAALPWVFLAVTLELGGQYPIAAWTLAGWAVHLAVDALGPQGVVCAGRRAAARLYSGALRPALALLGMLAAGCLWILGLRWTPSHPLHARLAPLPARPGTVTSVPVPGVLLAAGAACAAVAIRSWAAASRIAGSPPRGEDMRFLPEQVGVQLHPDALDGMPYLPVLVGLSPRAAGRPVAMLCCLEPPRPDERAVELRFDGRSTRFDLVSPSRFRPEWYGARLPDAWAGNGPCGVVPLHGAAGEILLAAQAYAKRHGHRLVDEWHVVSCACFRLQRRLERLLERATQNLERLAPLAPLRDDSALIVSPEVVRLLVRAEEARVRAGAPKAALWKYLWLTTIHAYGRGHSAWYDWAREEDVVLRMPDELPPPAPEPGRGQAPGGGHARGESRKATVEPVSSEAEVPSILDEMCQELVALARRGALPPVYGRDAELDQMVETLTRAEKCNPVLVGEPGVGKTAVVHLLAQTVAHHPERLPERLRGLRIYEWDHAGMVAGTQYRGQFEERLKQLLDALSAHPNAVLFVDEIHLLVGAGRAEGGAVAGAGQLLKPALASGRIRVMGATTPSEYRVIESDPALERRFQPVWVRELSPEMAERALRAVIAPDLEHRHGVRIHPEAIQAAVALTVRYVPDRRLPDKAKELLDQAAARVAWKESGEAVTDRHVARIVEERTGIPVVVPSEDARQVVAKLARYLDGRVVGQRQAVQVVAAAVARYQLGIRTTGRPLGPFLFYGPTGVGKTELAKALAEVVSGPRAQPVTINLSEYHDRYTASRLIGAPPGYIGHGEGGQLTEPVRRNPYCVVLLDEVEKAHPDVLNVLLRVLDEGKLADASGRVVDFSNACLVLTSNLGAEAFRGVDPDDGPGVEGALKVALQALRASLRPEFFNRLRPVPFRPLGRASMEHIARAMVDRLCREVQSNLRPSGIALEVRVQEDAVRWLATNGYDPELGARPLRRLVEEHFGDLLAEALAGRRGRVRVVVRSGPGGLVVQAGSGQPEHRG